MTETHDKQCSTLCLQHHFFIVFLSILPPPSFHPPNPSFDPPRPPLTPPEAHLDPILPHLHLNRKVNPRWIFKVLVFDFFVIEPSFDAIWAPLGGPKAAKDAQEAQRGPKSSPLEGDRAGPFSMIFRLYRPKAPQAPPRRPQDASRRPNDAPRRPPRRPKTPSRRPQDAPRRLQDVPRGLPDVP